MWEHWGKGDFSEKEQTKFSREKQKSNVIELLKTHGSWIIMSSQTLSPFHCQKATKVGTLPEEGVHQQSHRIKETKDPIEYRGEGTL